MRPRSKFQTHTLQVEDRSAGTSSQVSLNIAIKGGFFCAIFGPACNRFLYAWGFLCLGGLAYRCL
jgi:hypothetical protein